MLFEDQFEQIKEYSQSLQARVEENSTFNSLRDKYSALSPLLQKFLASSICVLIIFLILAGPLVNYQTSVENMTAFEEHKAITQQIITYKKKASSSSLKPREYNLQNLQSEVENLSRSHSINLLPNQTSVASNPVNKKTVPGAEQKNFKVDTTKVNINQFATLTYSVQKINKSLLVDSIELNANKDNSAYFDGTIYVANLFVKSASDILPKPEVNKKKKSRRRRRGSR